MAKKKTAQRPADALEAVTFDRKHGVYNAGETAGFKPEKVKSLIKDGIAHRAGDEPAKPKQSTGGKPNDGKNDWQKTSVEKLGLSDDVAAALVVGGLKTAGDVLAKAKADGSIQSIEGIDADAEAAVIKAIESLKS